MNIGQTRRRLWRVLPAAAAAVMLLGVPTMTASASAQPRAGHSLILFLSADRSNAVLIPAPGVSKTAYDPNRDARLLGIGTATQTAPATTSSVSFSAQPTSASSPSRTVTSSQTLSASNSIWTCPPGGSCANTGTNFSTGVTWHSGIQGTATFAGQSHADWWGCCPYNATNMYLSDTWRVGGLAVSVSFPPGVGISGSGDQANWSSGAVGNTWYINHYFNGIQFSSYVLVCCASESSTGESQFGSNFYSTTANG